ncbi:MAG: enoyl-CoA hydratase-related protein [bacterium]|nr:enoyl-CoA hydratase-related protein [bacterium]
MAEIQITKKEGYALLTIDRPKALNALNKDVLTELKAAISELNSAGDIRVVIVTGSGEKAFVAGADIASMKDMTADEATAFAELGHSAMNRLSDSGMVSIAAINGFALGGGMELALACDIRLLSENAKMGLPEVTLGLIPGFGGTQRLARIVGQGVATELILTGDMIDASRARELGLANHVYAPGDLLNEAEALAQKIIANKSRPAQRAAKAVIQQGLDLALIAGLQKEIIEFGELFDGPDPKTGMTAFLEKRKADF